MKSRRLLLFFLLFCLLSFPACTPPPPTVKAHPGQLTYVADLNGKYKIMVMDKSGKPVQITHDATAELQPSWSPDGKMVAFETSRHIFKMNADGTNVIQLTTQADYDSYPAWSLDGRQIAFEAYGRAGMPDSAYMSEGGNLDVFVMNADGSNPINLTQNGFYDLDPTWRP